MSKIIALASLSFVLWVLRIVVSVGGLGFLPKASGTFTSAAVALGLGFAGSRLSASVVLMGAGILFVAGVFAARWYEERVHRDDPPEVTIDEAVGMLLSVFFVLEEPVFIFVGFLLFRFFDIWKPLGIQFLDSLPWRGWATMLDDVLAGLYSALILWGIVLGTEYVSSL